MQHVAQFGHSYGTIEEFTYRQNLYAAVDEEINTINADLTNTHVAGHNFLSTMSGFEKSKLLGYKAHNGTRSEETLEAANGSVDWRSKGAVNAVQNQASCGSCWTFSATAAVEGAHFIKTGKLVKLSEEQLVQCSKKNNGCGGGSMELAFEYLEKPGQNTEVNYPYTSGRGLTGHCNTKLEGGDVHTTGYKNVSQNNADALNAAIAKGVVSVAIEADQSVFQTYQSGVLSGAACGTNLDHGVAAVGYGNDGTQDYVIIRNSWGASWGDHGYIKLAKAAGEGTCGVNMDASYPQTN
jgi:KDEL-tailed cysteine endopeptidase